jgi:hypothetical protein
VGSAAPFPAINQHLRTLYDDGELNQNSVVKNYLMTASDGKQYNTKHYNLQAIIAVGFKVNKTTTKSSRGLNAQIFEEEYKTIVRDVLTAKDAKNSKQDMLFSRFDDYLKHLSALYDYVIYDFSNERDFAAEPEAHTTGQNGDGRLCEKERKEKRES